MGLLFAKVLVHPWAMTAQPDWERLGRYVRAARGPRSQKDIAANGGPSDTTIGKIEAGVWRPTRAVNQTLAKLDKGLGWAPGSAARILDGGEPTPLTPDADKFLSKIRHPYISEQVAQAIDREDPDLIEVLDELLQTGELPANAEAQLERLRDDAAIQQFPKLYEQLTRPGKLKVAHYGRRVYYSEMEERHAVVTAPTSGAPVQTSPQVEEDEEPVRAGSLHDAQAGTVAGLEAAVSEAAAELEVEQRDEGRQKPS